MKRLKAFVNSSAKSSGKVDTRSMAAKIESHLLSGQTATVTFIFILFNLLQFWWGAVEEAHHQPDDYRKYTIPIARGAGYMMNLDMVLILLFASRFLITTLRKTPINILFPFDHAMPQFHIVIGYVIYGASAVHGIFHVAPGIKANHWQGGFGGWTFCVVTGLIIFAIFTLMIFTARKKTRNEKFELFYYTHIVCAFLFVVLLFLHGNFRGKLYTYKWIAGPVFLYAVDRIVRKLSEHRGLVNISSTSAPSCGAGIFRLAVPKCFDYKPGQYAEIKVPSISKHQWHPFTIASAPHEDEMVFFIKVAGDWTKQVQNLVKELSMKAEDSHSSLGPEAIPESFRLFVRGPYGSPSQHVGQYEKVVLVAGGIGTTPFSSITKDAVHYVEDRLGTEDDEESEAISSGSSSDFRLERKNTMTKATMAHAGQTFTNGLSFLPESSDHESTHDGSFHMAFRSIGDRLKIVLHSVTAQTALLWIILVRLFLTFTAASMKETKLANSPGFRVATDGYMASDLALTISFMIPFLASLLVDFPQMNRYTLLDTFILAPLIIMTVIGHILGLADVGVNNPSTEAWPYIYYFFIFPSTIIFFCWRYIRIVGEASIIAPSLGYKNKDTKSLDFIWTTPTREADEWLVRELEPHAFSKHLRLHRFVTREKADPEAGSEGLGRFSNNYGRPKWDEVFNTLVMNSKSSSTIGVFFCGPKPMENAVHKALIDAMVQSTERGHRYRSMPNSRKSKRGCYVRFVFRAENF